MSRRICLLRHAKSSWDEPRLDDFERPLNNRGQRDAPAMGRLLREKGINPSLIISSDAVRARDTAEAVARELGYAGSAIHYSHSLYLAPPAVYLGLIEKYSTTGTELLLVGHNPGITELINRISDARIDNVPTCGFAAIDFAGNSDFIPGGGHGRLNMFLYPRQDLNH